MSREGKFRGRMYTCNVCFLVTFRCIGGKPRRALRRKSDFDSLFGKFMNYTLTGFRGCVKRMIYIMFGICIYIFISVLHIRSCAL